MKRIAIDMDEVIADFQKKHLEQYNLNFNETLALEDLTGTKLRTLRPDATKELLSYIDTPGFFRDLKVMEGSQDVIRELSEQYEIFIATAAMEHPVSLPDKYEWLREHFPFLNPLNLVFCGDKSIVHADYLVDDNARHFEHFQGQGILFSAPHNLHETGQIRVNNWVEAREYFLGTRRHLQ